MIHNYYKANLCEHCKKQGEITCGNDTINHQCFESKRKWETIERNPCQINGHVGTCKNCPDKNKCDNDFGALIFDNLGRVRYV